MKELASGRSRVSPKTPRAVTSNEQPTPGEEQEKSTGGARERGRGRRVRGERRGGTRCAQDCLDSVDFVSTSSQGTPTPNSSGPHSWV